ncbi:MAG: GNAT family N-acetyltransferase [Treponema sp.]|nr:GNAT family N-acetyltransferase [Treponema sp.]
MENIIYNSTKKDLPSNQLHKLFVAVGWSDGSDSPEMINKYNIPFLNSTFVISAWYNKKLVGVVRVLSDKIFRSIIYDLIVDPEFQGNGIGSELIKLCINKYPNSEWLVETKENIAGFYENIGFKMCGKDDVFLNIPCKLFTKI